MPDGRSLALLKLLSKPKIVSEYFVDPNVHYFTDPDETKAAGRPAVAKMKLSSTMTNVKESASLESSKSTPQANSVSGIVSSASSRKISEKDKEKKKSGSGLSKFKTGFFGKGKKKVEKDTVVATGKELKQRLFFREKKELTDEEILQAIGADDSQKILAQSMDEIANAATVMKKFLDGKRPPSPSCKPGDMTIPGSVVYVGSLKARLSKAGEDEVSLEAIRRNPVMSSTVFLGKMISRKDKDGLIRGSSGLSGDQETETSRDNPLIAALEKVKLRQQSLDTDSRAASRTSHVRYIS